ncbi:MAG TPA: proteasome subunit alpha [Acidimicrobiales bacterium]|nr:proteasome subunit alpha [Acidimicrobiales bacterium]
MSMPFYVPAEQMMKDKADFARKNIARGKTLVAMLYADGILICAENTSATLRKVSEIYDRIAFAGAGKYNEYDRLRIAGVRHADLKGYSFSREDVDAQSLANAYAQMLSDVFTHEIKPMEVEIVVAELGVDPSGDRLFHIFYDGTVVDEKDFTVLGGGEADAITERVKQTYEPGRPLDAALRAAVAALAGDRRLTSDDLEIAVLNRGDGRRAFRRLTAEQVDATLGGDSGGASTDDSGGAEAADQAEAADVPAPADETATPTPEAPDAGSGDAGG